MSVGVTWRDDEAGWLVRAGADSRAGIDRERNEDFVWLDPELPLALVLDGLGAGPRSEEAHRRVVDAMRQRARAGREDGERPETLLDAAFRAGNQAILRLRAEPEMRGFIASVAAAWFQFGVAHVTWLGNSQRLRVSNGELEPLAWPHTRRAELVQPGKLSGPRADDRLIQNAVVRYLGRWDHSLKLEVASFAARPGDRLVLTTDGILHRLPADAIRNACRVISDCASCAEAIVEHALMAGARDDCTCTVLAFEPYATAEPEPEVAPDPAAPPRRWWFWR